MWYCYLLENQRKLALLEQEKMLYERILLSNQLLLRGLQLEQLSNISANLLYNPLFQYETQNKPIQPPVRQEVQGEKVKLYDQKISDSKTYDLQPLRKELAQKNSRKIKKCKKVKEEEIVCGKNPGRNSTSNIFRVFLKLCCKPKIEQLVRQKFEQIAKSSSLSITYDYFKLRLKELAPSTSNYINMKEFKKIWNNSTQFSRAFRCLFHWFGKNFAINHSLTLKGKHKMMKESIVHFLANLRNIEQELDQNLEAQAGDKELEIRDKSDRIKSEDTD